MEHSVFASDILNAMPLIRIEYDDNQVSAEAAKTLSEFVRDLVSEVTDIKDVFVYTNSSQIKIQVAPIEIFIEMSASKIKDKEQLASDIKERLGLWKKTNVFAYPINLTLIPVDWVVEIDI